jgi:hypothetical protein
MKKYQVDLAYTGYVSVEIEAETQEEAIEKVEAMGTAGMGNIERWPEADMIEETSDSPDMPDVELPQEGDYLISTCGPLGIWTKITVTGDSSICEVFDGEDQDDRVRVWIRNRMNQENFYPNVWMLSDHGNLALTMIKGEVQ